MFNRPALADQLAKQVARIHPSKVYVIADHAREGVPGETEKVQASVENVLAALPADCEVILDQADHNMGCDQRITDGLNKVFSKEEMAIILEDDCMPDLTFFDYAGQLLERYKQELAVKYIAGSNQIDTIAVPDSYAFTYNAWTWGWATWARTWKEMLPLNDSWQEVRKDMGKLTMLPGRQRRELRKTIDTYAKKGVIPWDYILGVSVMLQKGLSIVPKTNLIVNMGFSEDATHTGTGIEGYYPQTVPMAFPMEHPSEIKPLKGYVSHAYKWHRESLTHKLISPAFYKRVLRRLRKK